MHDEIRARAMEHLIWWASIHPNECQCHLSQPGKPWLWWIGPVLVVVLMVLLFKRQFMQDKTVKTMMVVILTAMVCVALIWMFGCPSCPKKDFDPYER